MSCCRRIFVSFAFILTFRELVIVSSFIFFRMIFSNVHVQERFVLVRFITARALKNVPGVCQFVYSSRAGTFKPFRAQAASIRSLIRMNAFVNIQYLSVVESLATYRACIFLFAGIGMCFSDMASVSTWMFICFVTQCTTVRISDFVMRTLGKNNLLQNILQQQ